MARISKSAFPYALTYTNLCLGIISILTSMNGSYKLSALLIIAACLADRYGGIAGKRLKVSSDYGRQLVSLADLVPFGIAPSILVFMLYGFEDFGPAGYLLVLVFPVAAAHRIAAGRFYVSPVLAGTTLAVFALITADKPVVQELAVIIVAALSYLLASIFTSTRG
jgi:CDP-diacylglycerol--serine O-phosphatidyltransferase